MFVLLQNLYILRLKLQMLSFSLPNLSLTKESWKNEWAISDFVVSMMYSSSSLRGATC